MKNKRDIHPDFLYYLKYKDQELVNLYTDLRKFVLSLYSESNEFLYHTHALTSVYSISEKLGDAFCMIPIYTNHLNLGFNKGALLEDHNNLLQGTGKLIRHIPVKKPENYRNDRIKSLIHSAINLAKSDTHFKTQKMGLTINKIRR